MVSLLNKKFLWFSIALFWRNEIEQYILLFYPYRTTRYENKNSLDWVHGLLLCSLRSKWKIGSKCYFYFMLFLLKIQTFTRRKQMDFKEFTLKKPWNGMPYRAGKIVKRENLFHPSESGHVMNDYFPFIIWEKTEMTRFY